MTSDYNLLGKHERLIILCLCLVGAVRIFVFSAAFPVFNNVDEQYHLDLVHKYARGHIPRAGAEDFDYDALKLIALYNSPEYLSESKDAAVPAPNWTIPNIQNSSELNDYLTSLTKRVKNIQAGSFPVYYAIAGLWYDAGKLLGLAGGQLLYWLRFLNIPFFVLLVWISYVISRDLYAQGDPARIALPLIVTFFPQDAFYSISNDALSPLLFAAAFYMLIQIYRRDESYMYHLFAGIIAAAVFLTKISNIAIAVLVVIVALFRLRKSYSKKNVRQYLPKLLVLSAGAIIPVLLWLARNYFVMGDTLGASQKAASLGWTVKPVNQILNHPMFTAQGITYFLTELTARFWRGEFTWHLKPIASGQMDSFYIISTAVFIVISGAVFLVKNKTDEKDRFEIGASFLVLLVSVLFLAFLSIRFDFGRCFYPSRQNPYITSGRLIDGMLIPFLVIYVDGLRRILSFFRSRALIIVVTVIVIAITWSEISISMDAFKSPYNWFHLQ
jgi:hypothetical protein